MDKILQKAKQEYNDALRGYNYQIELTSKDKFADKQDLDNINERRKMFMTKVLLLEDVFTKKLLIS